MLLLITLMLSGCAAHRAVVTAYDDGYEFVNYRETNFIIMREDAFNYSLTLAIETGAATCQNSY